MPYKKEPKESFDRFSEYMRQRLENYSMPLDDDCWKEIVARRQSMTRRKRFRMAAAVLSAAAVLATLLWINAPAPQGRFMDPAAEDRTVAKGPAALAPREPVTDEAATEAGPLLLADAPAAKKVKDAALQAAKSDEAPVTLFVEPIEDASVGPVEDASAKPGFPVGPESADNVPVRLSDSGRYDSFMQPEAPAARKAGKKDKWLVSAMFGSGESFSLTPGSSYLYVNGDYDNIQNDPAPPAPYRSDQAIVPPEYTHVIPDYTDKTYLPPLSFGIMLRRELGGHIAVESGLVYTYLSTKFRRSAIPRSEAQLRLHYLGIPVNLVAYLYHNARWDVYAAAGVMAEKGVRSFYEQRQYAGDHVIVSDINTSIDGMQWSLNASLGVSYNIHEAWSIYLEPRLSYYFDSGQPVSMRTEHPTTIGLGAGVRYGF
jgi:hypothetical protein